MCPQAHASIALHSNVDIYAKDQLGDRVLMQVASNTVECSDAEGSTFSYEKTVCGYLMAKIDKRRITFKDFLVNPAIHNNRLPKNMYLLCGDNNLEVIAKRLEGERSLPPTKGGPWRKVTEFMKAFVDGVVSADHEKRTYTFFIDTNPSFAVYTELAVLAGNRLIVPFSSGDFSSTAVKSMFYLLYGKHNYSERQVKYEHLQEYEFWYRAKQEDLCLPQIHLLINNKIAPHMTPVVMTFREKEKEIYVHLKGLMNKEPSLFVNHDDSNIMCHLYDFHTFALQCLHLGCPLRNLPDNIAMANWNIENVVKDRQVNLEKIEDIVKLL